MPVAPQRGDRGKRRVTRKHDRRPSSGRRGYGRRWQTYSRGYLARNPLCVICARNGITRASEATDHIKPVTGPDDPLFWPESNHQALCWSCHSRKTATENQR